MKTRLLIAALACVCVVAVAYALRARDSSINGWAEAARLQSELSKSEQSKERLTDAEAAYRALWEALVKKPGADDLTFVLAVNDYIHHNVPFGTNGNVPGTIPDRLTNALLGGGETAICGDYSTFLQMVLQAAGVPARTVQLASAKYAETGDPMAPTHVTVEAMIEGRWILVDATFDATFSCAGDPKLIGVEEARQCPKLVYNQHPNTIRETERQVATHPFSFPDLLAYSMTSATRVDDKPVEWFGYPNPDWLVKVQAMQLTPQSAQNNMP